MAFHLVILKKPYLDAILAGQKRIESRFSKTRRSYFGRVLAGDRILFKQSSGPVCGVATVEAVEDFEGLTPKRIAQLKRRYNGGICGSDEYWQSKADSRFGMLVWLKDVERIAPVRIIKRDWRAWVVLTEQENFGLLKDNGLK
jgi:ASC-1-like (ASCH) protein